MIETRPCPIPRHQSAQIEIGQKHGPSCMETRLNTTQMPPARSLQQTLQCCDYRQERRGINEHGSNWRQSLWGGTHQVQSIRPSMTRRQRPITYSLSKSPAQWETKRDREEVSEDEHGANGLGSETVLFLGSGEYALDLSQQISPLQPTNLKVRQHPFHLRRDGVVIRSGTKHPCPTVSFWEP
jgi:hypothetical protein